MIKKTWRQHRTDDDAADFGFRWGQLDVLRIGVMRENKFLGILTDFHELSVSVSPQGRSVRAFQDGIELVDPTPLNEEITRLRAELQEAKSHAHRGDSH